ncbi:MAG: AgmX/PglI C-terminal domain-containing protein [Acidobacteriota bacterium]
MWPKHLAIAAYLVGLAGVATAAPARVVLGTPTSRSARFDAGAVAAIVDHSRDRLLACYAAERATCADLRDDGMTVTFTIGNAGKVTAIQLNGRNHGVDACISATISRLHFAAPPAGATIDVDLPLTFKARSSVEQVAADIPVTGDGPRYGHLTGGGGTCCDSMPIGRDVSRDPPGPEATMSLGAPSVNGDLDTAIVRRYIKRSYGKLMYCYEKARPADPKLHGTMNAAFTIGANGAVKSSAAGGVSAEVAACVADEIKSIEFPKPRTAGDVDVCYPLTFESIRVKARPPRAPR